MTSPLPASSAQTLTQPKPQTDTMSLSALALAKLIREGDLTSRQVVEAHIQRIEAVNPALNAVVADRFEAAREAADAADTRRAQSKHPQTLPPLLGVPCTVKEFIAVKGMPQTGGLWVRRDRRAQHDAVVVQRIKAAGAIVLGVTNAPEGGLSPETFNLVHGRTKNPWNLDRTCGGSSGGEGAIIAAGGSPFGLGSDVGGSVRLPSAFCGIAGHKPTGRMVPNTGHWPRGSGMLDAYLAIGPMARHVSDLMPLLRLMAGPDPDAPLTKPWLLEDPDAVDLRQVTVHPMIDHIAGGRVQSVMRRAVENAMSAAKDAGAKTAPINTKPFRRAFDIWASAMTEVQEQSYAQILGGGDRPVSLLAEIGRWAIRRPRITPAAMMMIVAESLTKLIPAHRMRAAVEAGRDLQAQLEKTLGPNGVLICPPYTQPAPRHDSTLFNPFDFACTGIFNVLEFPGTVVPFGFDAHGLPLSVQIVAARGRDHIALAVAAALERATGGWICAPHPAAPHPAA